MGAIVIRTRYDEGTESAEVVTSGPTEWVRKNGANLVTGSSNNKTLNARLLARVITGCHYT
jgi:hypothetical protein